MPKQKALPQLTSQEQAQLKQLYFDGAWTTTEALNRFTSFRLNELNELDLLYPLATDIGTLYFLTALGRKTVFGLQNDPKRISAQVDTAYLRLCAEEYGWMPIAGDKEISQYDTSNRGVTYQTPQGKALVFGSLTHPITPQGIKNLANKFRSLALSKNFLIIIFTSNSIRGQSAASKESEYLQLIYHIPNSQEQPNRIHKIEKDSEYKSTYAGPAITPITAEQLTEKGYLSEQIQTYLLPLKERIERAMHDLEVDEVMSFGQLQRYYQLNPGDLVGVNYTRDFVQPSHNNRGTEKAVVFFCASKSLAKKEATWLAHRAGTKELRHLIGAPANPKVWKIEERNSHRAEEPDAYWESEQGKIAVEYDTGSYSATTVQFKIRKFNERGSARIVWGVVSPLRQSRLQQKFGLEVKLCHWWKGIDDE